MWFSFNLIVNYIVILIYLQCYPGIPGPILDIGTGVRFLEHNFFLKKKLFSFYPLNRSFFTIFYQNIRALDCLRLLYSTEVKNRPWLYMIKVVQPLREKCPNTEFFWSTFSCIRTRKNSVFELFSHSEHYVKD